MNAMSQKAKITLEKYRAAESLGERTRARLFETLERRVAAGDWPAQGVDVGPPPAVSPGGFAAKVISGPVGKIGLGLIIAAVPAAWLLAQRDAREVGEAAVAKGTEGRQPPQKAVETAPKSAATVGQSARRAATANETGEVVAPARSGHAEPSLGRPTRPARAREAPNAPGGPQDTQSVAPEAANSASAAAPKLDTIDEEVSLLGSAHASLRAGRASEALAKLAEHKRRFPASKLAESREVARIIALCQAGQRETARAAAEVFLATRSGSPLANRVRTVCADTGKK